MLLFPFFCPAAALQRAQQEERQYLAKAFQRVGDLERRRAAALKEVFTGVVGMYK